MKIRLYPIPKPTLLIDKWNLIAIKTGTKIKVVLFIATGILYGGCVAVFRTVSTNLDSDPIGALIASQPVIDPGNSRFSIELNRALSYKENQSLIQSINGKCASKSSDICIYTNHFFEEKISTAPFSELKRTDWDVEIHFRKNKSAYKAVHIAIHRY